MLSPRGQRLYHYLVTHRWGEPADIVVFEGASSKRPGALTIDVLIWDADDSCDVTSFMTVGMSERVMPRADYRAELTLGCRRRLSAPERGQLAAFLANVAQYPFHHDLKLDWWERLANPGRIPVFQDCRQVLLAPMLGEAEDEFRTFPEPDDDVKLLSVVPITPREDHILAEHGPQAFLDYREESGVDIFSPRRDA